MKNYRILLLALLASPALLALNFPATRVRFAPADGASVVKTFENKAEFSLDNMGMTMNGSELPSRPDMDMTITSVQKMVVTDEYLATADGSPTKLKRRFDEIANDMTMAMQMEIMGQSSDQDSSVASETELEGKTVLFAWDGDAKEFKKSFDPPQEDAELLEGLTEDMDFRVLLPKGEVNEGDEWEIDVKSLVSVLAPGGDMKLVPKESGDDAMGMGMAPGMGGSMNDWLDEIEGEAKAKFAGMREVGDAKLAVISFTLDVQSAKDMTDVVTEAMKNAKLPPGAGDITVDHMDIEVKLEGEGELLWDLATGHAVAFEMSGPAHMAMDMAMKMSAQGQNLSIEQNMEFSGTTSMTVKFE
jgi:hypothetical protein